MCLMHDIAEIRTGDAHRIAQRYLDMPSLEKGFNEQIKSLPPAASKRLKALWEEFQEQKLLNLGLLATLIFWKQSCKLKNI